MAMTMWPELLKTKKNIQNISLEVDRLLKNHNALYKKELADHKEQLVTDTREAVEIINEEIRQLKRNMENHRKQLEAKANFLKRHNKRI